MCSSSQSASPEQVADWLISGVKLDSLIENEPAGDWTWLWRIRRAIAFYLLRRYGSDESAQDVFPSSKAKRPVCGTLGESTEMHASARDRVEISSSLLHPPRAQNDFRDLLSEVHEINEAVRLAQRDRRETIVRLTYPKEYIQLHYGLFSDWEGAIPQPDYDAFREQMGQIPDPKDLRTTLTDEYVLEILSTEAQRERDSSTKSDRT